MTTAPAAKAEEEQARVRRLVAATGRLRSRVDALSFGAPVTHVYNPLHYAARPHRAYLRTLAWSL